MAGRTDYKNSWIALNRSRIGLIVQPGFKERVQKAASTEGISMNEYIVRAVSDRLEMDAGMKK